ncbi:MAG: serine/threonine protein kinase [Lentisphaeria bacterium]|nr:serine/threonine protein kinase [Lentisphaeria bacterium]
MTDNKETVFNDPEKTIASFSGGEVISDYAALREEFAIFPGEDGAKYRNMKLLGMGGMGVVYSADDPTLQRQVALKILREPYRQNRELIAKFVNEARITARIDHPNIAAVHQLGVNKHLGVYFSMRRISGETLQNALRRLRENDPEARRTYTRRRLLDIFIAGCNGVAAAHEKKILHCDLKPANIMIGSFGEVLVLDWGLARDFSAREKRDRNTISGTPAYMAPELVTGEQEFPDEQTEVYALGTILHSIITWQQAPFDLSLEKTAVMERAAMGKYLPLAPADGNKASKELTAICRKAMAKERSERYRTVSELINDLHNYRDGYPVAAYSPNIFYRFFKRCRRHPVIPLTVIAASLALILNFFAGNFINYAHDRTLQSSLMISLELAENNYRKLAIELRRQIDFDEPDAILRNAAMRKDQQRQSQLTLMGFFSVLDSASGLSPAGKREFARDHAPDIFRRIIRISMLPVNSSHFDETIEKVYRSEFFGSASKSDTVLEKLAEKIRMRTGTVFFHSSGTPWKNPVKVRYSGGKVFRITPDGSGRADLPAGNCSIIFDNGTKIFLRIIPGTRISAVVPEGTDNSGGVKKIPADHFFINIPGVGEALCDLPEFSVVAVRLPQRFTHEEAEKEIEKFNRISKSGTWKLPNAAQWYKIWRHDGDSGKNFYGFTAPGRVPVLLNNGEFFDPVVKHVARRVPAGKGVLYLVQNHQSDETK